MRRQVRSGIAWKLLASPLVLIALLIAVGFVSRLATQTLLRELEGIDRSYALAIGAQKLQADLLREATGIANYVLYADSRDIADYQAAGTRVPETLQPLLEIAEDETVRQQLLDIQEKHGAYTDAVDRIRNHLRSQRQSQAILLMQTEAVPTLREMTAAVDSLVESLTSGTSADLTGSRNLAGVLDVGVIAASFAAVVLGLAVALVMSRRLLRPIRNLSEAAAAIAAGNLSAQEVTVTSQDEVGNTIRAFNEMARNLHDVLQRVSRSAEAVRAASVELTGFARSSAEAAASTGVAAGPRDLRGQHHGRAAAGDHRLHRRRCRPVGGGPPTGHGTAETHDRKPGPDGPAGMEYRRAGGSGDGAGAVRRGRHRADAGRNGGHRRGGGPRSRAHAGAGAAPGPDRHDQ